VIAVAAGAVQGIAAEQAAKTHCVRGHPFDEENAYVDRRGYRVFGPAGTWTSAVAASAIVTPRIG
jgi:hypothetical protein